MPMISARTSPPSGPLNSSPSSAKAALAATSSPMIEHNHREVVLRADDRMVDPVIASPGVITAAADVSVWSPLSALPLGQRPTYRWLARESAPARNRAPAARRADRCCGIRDRYKHRAKIPLLPPFGQG